MNILCKLVLTEFAGEPQGIIDGDYYLDLTAC